MYSKVTSYLKKLESRSKKGVLIGYTPHGFKLWDPITNKTYLSRDVTFTETLYSPETPQATKRVRNRNIKTTQGPDDADTDDTETGNDVDEDQSSSHDQCMDFEEHHLFDHQSPPSSPAGALQVSSMSQRSQMERGD